MQGPLEYGAAVDADYGDEGATGILRTVDTESSGRRTEYDRPIADWTAHCDRRVCLWRDEDLEQHQWNMIPTALRSVMPAALWPAVAASTRPVTTSAFRAMIVAGLSGVAAVASTSA